MKRIVFQSNQLSVRGTEIALYDYACGNEDFLGNQSIIAYQSNHPANEASVIAKFSKKFQLLPYSNIIALDQFLREIKADFLYAIKAGEPDEVISSVVPTMVHAVFPQDPMMAHGSSYAFVSDWLSKVCSHGVIPAVPHIVPLPDVDEDLRLGIGIPSNATVFGCYGGASSFDIKFAQKVVMDLVGLRNDIYFLFMNIHPFANHPQIIFLPSSADLVFKVKFINTCDAMLHARKLGESFGLACAEFSIRNKPVFTYSKSPQRHHIETLGDKANLYSGYKSLMNQLMQFDRVSSSHKSWDCYSEKFSPQRVMALFDRYLIQIAEKNGISSAKVHMKFVDKLACRREEMKLKAIKLSRIWAR